MADQVCQDAVLSENILLKRQFWIHFTNCTYSETVVMGDPYASKVEVTLVIWMKLILTLKVRITVKIFKLAHKPA
jgi:hypothetical protein